MHISQTINIHVTPITYCMCRYRACYEYEIVSGAECVLDLSSLRVDAVQTVPLENSTVISVNTPLTIDGVYPPNLICFFRIGNK